MCLLLRYLLVPVVVVNLTACSTFFGPHNFVQQRETEYLRSSEVPPLQLPPGLSAANVGEDYGIPSIAAPVPTQPVSITPPDSLADKIDRGIVPAAVLKEKPAPVSHSVSPAPVTQAQLPSNISGPTNDPILALNQSTAQLWDKIGTALKAAGYIVANKDQNAGIYYLLDTPTTNGGVQLQTPIYQLHLHDMISGTQAYVTDNQGKLLDPAIAKRILTELNHALLAANVS